MNQTSAKKSVFLRRTEKFSVYDDDTYHVYWEGIVFIGGLLSGEESVKAYIKEVHKVGIKEASRCLKGIFFMVIEEKRSGALYAFVDNSGLFQAFYTSNAISTSFLDLIKHGSHTTADLDPEAIIEFLYFGYLLTCSTFFKAIKIIAGGEILYFANRDGIIRVLKKNVADITMSEKGKSFHEVFENFAKSLSNRQVSLDLTGGVDTRLIALLLDFYGLRFETSISAGTPDYEDIAISKTIAELHGHPWYSVTHSIDSLEEDIPELFSATEGLYDVLYYHRLSQLQKARVSRGIDTMISGVGGEIFKDFWWLQDFPFYSKKTSNIERFVELRIMSHKPVQSFSSKPFSEMRQVLRDKIIRELSHYVLDTNTKTYDNIFLNVIMRKIAGRVVTSHSHYLKCYAPFLDPEIARIGFHLPRMIRMFNIFHRKELTRINPLIARMPTTEGGITASIEPMMIIRDFPKYLSEKAGRLLTKLNLRERKSFSGLNHPAIYHHVRKMKTMKESIEILKDSNIIHQEADLEQMEDNHLGSFLSLAMLIKHINN